MGVHTTYDEMRDSLRTNLAECLEISREMLDESIWGYNDMRSDYAIDVYLTIKKAKDII